MITSGYEIISLTFANFIMLIQRAQLSSAEPWKFLRVQWIECGDQKRHVAFFDWHGVEFALIPGGEFTLGWNHADREQFGHKPITEAEAQLRRYTVEDADIWQYLDLSLTPHRVVSINPFLVEVATCDPSDAPEPRDKEEIDGTTFRLLTADEWEYVFTGTWAPGQWFVFAAQHSFSQLLKHHPFGLRYVADQKESGYFAEYIHELDEVRGGDAGGNDGTGYTGLLGDLPEAPSYQPDESTIAALLQHTEMRSRRAFPLPETMFG